MGVPIIVNTGKLLEDLPALETEEAATGAPLACARHLAMEMCSPTAVRPRSGSLLSDGGSRARGNPPTAWPKGLVEESLAAQIRRPRAAECTMTTPKPRLRTGQSQKGLGGSVRSRGSNALDLRRSAMRVNESAGRPTILPVHAEKRTP